MDGETDFEAAKAAGWYPDDHIGGTMRYWDGRAWTEHTAGGYDHQAPTASPVHAPYQRTASSRPQLSFFDLNRQSLVSIGFAAAYLVLAQLAGIHLLGIVPVLAAFRAVTAKEPLGPVAMAVGITSVVIGLGVLG